MNGVWNTESILGGGLTGVKNRTVPLVAIQRANNPVSAPRSFEILTAGPLDRLRKNGQEAHTVPADAFLSSW